MGHTSKPCFHRVESNEVEDKVADGVNSQLWTPENHTQLQIT